MPNFDFKDSSFFKSHDELPLRHAVGLQARAQFRDHRRERPVD
jgi:hypothetical protein